MGQAARVAVARTRRRDLAPPAEFSGDPIVWAAWLYYEERMTQEEVAETMGVSRASIVNFLQEARERNLVTIAVASTHLQSVRIARALKERYGLTSCVVAPDDGGRGLDYERVARAGARFLEESLGDGDVLGVSWGRTVLALADALTPMRLPHVSVVQIAGSAIGTADFSPELCTSNIATRIGARCVNLHAPGIVSRPEIKSLFMQEPALVEQFELLRSCTKFLFGVTHLERAGDSVLRGWVSAEWLDAYAKDGAVGVLAGRFLDRDGRPVEGALDGRMIGLSLDEIRRIPRRICLAAGLRKVEAIEAALRGGYATVLVTDEPTAQALLERA